MKKTIISMFIVLCLLVANVSYASINGIQADTVFANKTAVLNSSGYLSVYLETFNYSDTIRINTCKLQKYNAISSSWDTLQINGLTVPGTLSISNFILTAGDYYTTYLVTGKYRFRLQVEADGAVRTIYSNAVVFN